MPHREEPGFRPDTSVSKLRNILGFGAKSGTSASPFWRNSVVIRSLGLLLVILWACYFSYSNLRNEVMTDAAQSAQERVHDVQVTLNMSNEFYLKQCQTAMGALRRETLTLGQPHLEGSVTVKDRTVPNLAFGTTLMGNNFVVVDEIKALMGGTSTLFVRDGDGFVRVTTNVQTSQGQRAVGTMLDPHGAAIGPLLAGHTFAGVVDILGKSFITEYDPITDADGKVIGAWYVGYPIETLTGLMTRIASMRILERGFVALLDNHNTIVAHTEGTDPTLIHEIVTNVATMAPSEDNATLISRAQLHHKVWHLGDNLALDSGWRVLKVTYQPWGYTILASTYLPDVFWRSFKVVWIGFLVMGCLGLAALLAQGTALAHTRVLKAKAEAAQRAAEEASRTKSAFLANMSHELRTPLNAIIGYSEMIIEEATDAMEDIIPDLQKIQSSGKHLLALINDILDLSKIEAGKMTLYLEDFDVMQIIQDVAATIRPLLEKNGNTLEITGRAEDLGTMRCDLTKTRQVLFNLLSNASKFTKEGKVQLAVERRGGRFYFRITDTGIGMTPAQMGRLFQEFSQADDSTTRKFGGTGLGLAICKRFCEMMGGTIEVESTPGVGSTFTVILPVKVAGEVATPPKAHETPSPAPVTLPTLAESPEANAWPCVLVVDDDPSARDLMRRILEKEHYRVVTIASGQQALELCATLKPCLITLDVMMPDVDGWAILKKLKSDPATADIPVVMVTMVDDKPLGFALGASEYITKPFDRNQIVGFLSRHGVKTAAPHILVVDDDPDVYQLISRALEKDGFKTAYAPNGQVALHMVAEAKPDLIVLDLNMPVMNGIDFLVELHRREGESHIPIVIFSAKDLTSSEAQLLCLSAKETLMKGQTSPHDLVDTVKRLVN